MSRLTFAVKREKGQPSLFDFGVEKLNEGGRVPIPASVGTAQPVSQATSQPEKPKTGPGRLGRPKKVGTTSGVAAKEALERQRAAHSGADGLDMWDTAPLEAPPARRKAKGRPLKEQLLAQPKEEADPRAARIRARSPSTSANPPPL